MPKEISDERSIFPYSFGALAVGDAGCLNDRFIAPHVVDDTYEPCVEDGKPLPEEPIEGRNPHPLNCCVLVSHRDPPLLRPICAPGPEPEAKPAWANR